MLAGQNVSLLMPVSAFGVYLHAFFVSLTLGLPLIISSLLFSWWRTGDEDYYKAARITTGVLAVNFALGAIMGTLVEFGLVQAWPGSIYAVATVAFAPLASELVAFIGEIVFLVAFIVTLRWVKPWMSIGLMAGYFAFAGFSGVLITLVNSWLNVPWGTGPLASVLYPYLPSYGPTAFDIPVLVAVKLALVDSLLTAGTASQILQNPETAKAIGISLNDLFVAFNSPYGLASVAHNLSAAIIIGMAFAAAAFAYKHLRTGDTKYVKLIRPFLPILLILLILQPIVFGHNMGSAVAAYMPTKFAMMEGVYTTKQNPLISFLAYGDPSKPILGFDEFVKKCETHGDITVGNVAAQVLPNYIPGPSSNIKLKDLCLMDLAEAQNRVAVINAAFYVKIGAGVVALTAVIGLVSATFNIGLLSRIVSTFSNRFGKRQLVFLFALLVVIGSVLPAVLGWYVREAGRKPWTVYGLLTPAELVTPVSVQPVTIAIFTAVFTAMAFGGVYGMYLVATKPLLFVKLLRKGAGEEE